MSLFLDKYLGKKLVSRRSIYIASIFATILIISTIWLTNIPTNKGDFLQKSPLKLWNLSIEATGKISTVYKNMDIGAGTPEELENLIHSIIKKIILDMEEDPQLPGYFRLGSLMDCGRDDKEPFYHLTFQDLFDSLNKSALAIAPS